MKVREAIVTEDVVYLPLTKGQTAIVDRDDYERLPLLKGNWLAWYSKESDAYYVFRKSLENGKIIRLHRYIMDAQPGVEVDHINHNPLDNRKANLRLCTHRQNACNGRKCGKFSSCYKGVYWFEKTGIWRSKITVNGKTHHIGHYDDERIAALAYDHAARQHHGEFAYLNFPDETIEPAILEQNPRRKEKTSRYYGVCWNKNEKKWRADIREKKKRYYLGYFTSEEDAAKAYDAKALELLGKTFNFPPAAA